jgi:drug/metabolite transporter (DMT)-like permease
VTTPVGELAGLCAAACWAIGSTLFARIGQGGASPAAMNAVKCSFAFVVLLGAAIVTSGSPWPQRPTLVEASLLGASALVGLAVGDTAYFGALRDLGASRAVLLLSTAPVFAVAVESLWLRRAPPSGELVGVLVTLAGLAIAIARREPSTSGSAHAARGVALGLVAGLAQAIGSLLSRAGTAGGVAPLTASWLRLGVGAAFVLGAGLVAGEARGWVAQLRAPGLLARVLGASVVGTVCGIFLSQVALARSSSGGVASTLLATSPLFALPIAHATGGDRITPRAAIGTLVAFVGVALLLR